MTTIEATKAPWEGPAMNMIHQYCERQNYAKSALVFYIHNKGASKWTPTWREDIQTNKTWTYGHSLYWRKYLEYFLIQRPELCLEELLLHNASTCGANWHFEMKNHYSGNFWAASCQHIEKLQLITSDDDNYIASEMWLGRYNGRDSNQSSKAFKFTPQ